MPNNLENNIRKYLLEAEELMKKVPKTASLYESLKSRFPG
jgi:hypothetical protein